MPRKFGSPWHLKSFLGGGEGRFWDVFGLRV